LGVKGKKKTEAWEEGLGGEVWVEGKDSSKNKVNGHAWRKNWAERKLEAKCVKISPKTCDQKGFWVRERAHRLDQFKKRKGLKRV